MKKSLKISAIIIIILGTIFIFRDNILVLAISFFYESEYEGEKLPLPALEDSLKAELTEYLANNHKSPEEYIISKFDDHDIIFVGEHHRIKHDAELIGSLVPELHKAGIYNIGMEFATWADQPLIDSLVNSAEYNQTLANKILFDWLVLWGYREYSDIFRAAWKLNKTIPAGEKKFRIVGLNIPQQTGNDDDVMEAVIEKKLLKKGEKALIYCGIHHAFTRYKYPVLKDGKFNHFFDHRVGNMIYKRIGDRAATIFLHSPWGAPRGKNYPVDGYIDTLMKTLPPELLRAGFDTRGTPFGNLPAKNNIYQYGYENFTLNDFCDGYIIQKPLPEYEGVATIENFINSDNIEAARKRFTNNSFDFLFSNFGPLFWNYAISMDADLKRMHEFGRYR